LDRLSASTLFARFRVACAVVAPRGVSPPVGRRSRHREVRSPGPRPGAAAAQAGRSRGEGPPVNGKSPRAARRSPSSERMPRDDEAPSPTARHGRRLLRGGRRVPSGDHRGRRCSLKGAATESCRRRRLGWRRMGVSAGGRKSRCRRGEPGHEAPARSARRQRPDPYHASRSLPPRTRHPRRRSGRISLVPDRSAERGRSSPQVDGNRAIAVDPNNTIGASPTRRGTRPGSATTSTR
jgi:hypothetical protein